MTTFGTHPPKPRKPFWRGLAKKLEPADDLYTATKLLMIFAGVTKDIP
jgi:hypothetical protein